MLRPDLAPLDSYMADAISISPEAFFTRHPWPVLVIPKPCEAILSQLRRPETVVHEVAHTTNDIDLTSPKLVGASLDAMCLEVRPVRGTDTSRITVGRSPDADVVLIDESVSRQHAELAWDPDRDRCVLTDLGPRNGTSVDSKRIAPNGTADLVPGDVVAFGAILARFYSPRAFLMWLSSGAPRSGASPGQWPARPE